MLAASMAEHLFAITGLNTSRAVAVTHTLGVQIAKYSAMLTARDPVEEASRLAVERVGVAARALFIELGLAGARLASAKGKALRDAGSSTSSEGATGWFVRKVLIERMEAAVAAKRAAATGEWPTAPTRALEWRGDLRETRWRVPSVGLPSPRMTLRHAQMRRLRQQRRGATGCGRHQQRGQRCQL